MRWGSGEIGSPGTLIHVDENNEGMNCWNNDCNIEDEVLRENLATAVFVHQTNQFKYTYVINFPPAEPNVPTLVICLPVWIFTPNFS